MSALHNAVHLNAQTCKEQMYSGVEPILEASSSFKAFLHSI